MTQQEGRQGANACRYRHH